MAMNAVNLQPRWLSSPIPNLVWSGPNATPELTLELIDLSKSTMLATVSHGQATLEELEDALGDYVTDVEELVIFHLDEGDYR